jgi:hypothetical protein
LGLKELGRNKQMKKIIIVASLLICNSVSADMYQIQDSQNKLNQLTMLEPKYKLAKQKAINSHRDICHAISDLEKSISAAKRADRSENKASDTTIDFKLYHPTEYIAEGSRRAGITYYGSAK